MNTTKILKEHKLKHTKLRANILHILDKATEPFDIQMIIDHLSVEADQASVYRSIEKLHNANIVKQIDFREGKYRYELNQDHHHHLVCTNCKKIQAIHENCSAQVEEQILKDFGFTVTEHHLEYFGLCKACQTN